LGGKNSKEKVGFPSTFAAASFWEMCMATTMERNEERREKLLQSSVFGEPSSEYW
jgi:hypothetical protein